MMWQVVVQVQPIAIPEQHLLHINMDVVGPLPASDGHSPLLTVIDLCTRLLEVIPLWSIMVATVANILVFGWITHFGIPEDLTLNRGVQFGSEA